MCHCGEIVDHLLLNCSASFDLGSFVLQSFGVQWVVLKTILDLLFGWWNWLGKHSSVVWNHVPLRLMWTVRCKRNQSTFEDLESSKSHLLATLLL